MSNSTTLRYETETMAEVRKLLTAGGMNDDTIDVFKGCLLILEHQGFVLTKDQSLRS